MLRQILAWIVAIAAGVVLGGASAWAALTFGVSALQQRITAPGRSIAPQARTAAGPYTRAIIARYGLLALSSREALYFNLDRDEHGQPLSESCIYDLTGNALATRWWSVTLYAGDSYLARNDDHAASVDASRINAGDDGVWRARISSVQGDSVNWLSSRNARRGFSLTLRVYNPQRDFAPSEESVAQAHHRLLREPVMSGWGKYIVAALLMAVVTHFVVIFGVPQRADGRRPCSVSGRSLQCLASR